MQMVRPLMKSSSASESWEGCAPGRGRKRGRRVEASPSEMAAAKRKKPPPKRATRSLLAARPTLRLPDVQLEPHHIDILGLGLIAVGILLGGVAYGGWDGGALGNGAVTGMRFVLGALGS